MLSHWIACAWWAIGHGTFRFLATPVTWDSPASQQYATSLYWALTTLLKVPFTTPETEGQILFTLFIVVLGAILFAFFNAEVHAIVRGSLGATLARNSAIDQLKQVFSKTRAGGLIQRTAIKWAGASATHARFKSDDKKEKDFVQLLPAALRSEVFGCIFPELRTHECGLEGRISAHAIAVIAAHCWPAVFLHQQVLLNAKSRSPDVFVLQHGSLRLSGGVSIGQASLSASRSAEKLGGGEPKAKFKEMDGRPGSKEGRSGAASVFVMRSQKNAAAFSMPALLPGAEGSRFRVLERPGSLVGSCDMSPHPFIVESLMLSHVLVLDTRSALKAMAGADASAFKEAVKAKEKVSVDYLKGVRRKTGFVAGAMAAAPADDDDDDSESVGPPSSAASPQRGKKPPTKAQVAAAELIDGDEAKKLEARASAIKTSLCALGDATAASCDELQKAMEKLKGGGGVGTSFLSDASSLDIPTLGDAPAS